MSFVHGGFAAGSWSCCPESGKLIIPLSPFKTHVGQVIDTLGVTSKLPAGAQKPGINGFASFSERYAARIGMSGCVKDRGDA